jgi:hypothetical protein
MNVSTLKLKLKNLTNGRKYITDIVKSQPEGVHFRHEEIELLLQYHPDHVEKGVGHIDYLVVRMRQPFNGKSLFIKSLDYDKEDDISYIMCIRELFGKLNRDTHVLAKVRMGFRDAVFNDNRNVFFNKNTKKVDGKYHGECVLCHIVSEAWIDHYGNPFKNILGTFLKSQSRTMSDVEVIEGHDNVISIVDEALKNQWILYHDSVVTYRILCRRCNTSMGSYGF